MPFSRRTASQKIDGQVIASIFGFHTIWGTMVSHAYAVDGGRICDRLIVVSIEA